MIQTRPAGKRLNVHINRFVTRVITPVVLVAGLLMLLLLHFRGVLAVTTAQNDLYLGQRSFSVGGLQSTFQEEAGTDRPGIFFQNAPVLTYQEWSSSISVDGNVSNLWDNYHGYDYDQSKRQVFSTTSGTGWQVVEVVNLVDAHTVRVDFQFVARHNGTKAPQHIVVTISHYHNALLQPTINGNTLTADVLPGNVQNFQGGTVVHPFGKITLTVSGPQVAPSAFAFQDLRGNVSNGGTLEQLANSFTTTYVLDNPQVDRLVPLGTETLTFADTLPAGVPVPGIGPTPTP